MANAVIKTDRVPITTYVTEEKVVLELSFHEAAVLTAILGNVGGGGKSRELSSGIYGAISGLVNVPFDTVKKIVNINETIYPHENFDITKEKIERY